MKHHPFSVVAVTLFSPINCSIAGALLLFGKSKHFRVAKQGLIEAIKALSSFSLHIQPFIS
jgi:hypothetical protein